MNPAPHRQRVALVTGGANGIGRAITERLASDGAAVVVADVDEAAANQFSAELSARGVQAAAYAVDVTDEGSVAKVYADVDRRFGALDILVNNAGIIVREQGRKAMVEDMTLNQWQRTMAVNLTGVFLMSRGAIPLMRRGGWGRIVNMSSRRARTAGGPGNAHYGTSKAGVIGFSRILATEVGAHGITVNCVAPSKVSTALTRAMASAEEEFRKNIAETAVGRLGQPEDVAHTVAFLCSEQAGFLTGTIVDVTGGSFMP